MEAMDTAIEAVMNAFQAIRDARKPAGSGRILVEIERDDSLLGKDDGPIHAVRIIDNGIGMDDDNFDFSTRRFPTAKRPRDAGGRRVRPA